jgi:hypothetical protein
MKTLAFPPALCYLWSLEGATGTAGSEICARRICGTCEIAWREKHLSRSVLIWKEARGPLN